MCSEEGSCLLHSITLQNAVQDLASPIQAASVAGWGIFHAFFVLRTEVTDDACKPLCDVGGNAPWTALLPQGTGTNGITSLNLGAACMSALPQLLQHRYAPMQAVQEKREALPGKKISIQF